MTKRIRVIGMGESGLMIEVGDQVFEIMVDPGGNFEDLVLKVCELFNMMIKEL